MDEVDAALQQYGLLLQQDKQLPSVVGIIVKEPLAGSWWSHAKAHQIFRRLGELEDAVLVSRLISGKVTYIDKQLWPAFLAIATSRESWQFEGLSREAHKLLENLPARAKGDAVRELQTRLLVAASEVHTESGKHEIEIESWESWAKKHHAAPTKDIDAARDQIERAVTNFGASVSTLPWRKRVARASGASSRRARGARYTENRKRS